MTKKWWMTLVAGLAPVGLLVGFAGPGAAVQQDAVRQDVVRTDGGLVAGTPAGDTRVFDGIPYAAPPVGSLRWKAPRPAQPWGGVRASKLQSACPQQPNSEVPDGTANEDCLYVNVTTPAAKSAKPRAVVVWIPGGGFFMGTGNSYGSARLAAQGDVVVVTVNYRLGIFGFFGYPGLPGSGTFGLQDQQAALRWVQRNARAFGGDPHNVTVAGESAGGMSVCAQLTSPTSTGLFAKAIMESGSCAYDWPDNGQYPGQAADSFWVPASRVEQNGKEYGEDNRAKLKCKPGQSTLDCLQAAKSDVLVEDTLNFTQSGYGASAVMPLNPDTAMKAGLFHRVPIISGNNHDEAAAWVAAFGDSINDYPQLVENMVGKAKAPAVLAHYPLSRYDSPAEAWTAVTTDRIWSCNQAATDAQAVARKVPVYAYEFADKKSPIIAPGLGAAHAAELPYLFEAGGIEKRLTPTQQQLSKQMIAYWTAFARTGNPNGPGRPHWSPNTTQSIKGLSLAPTDQTRIHPVNLTTEHQCAFWAGLN